MASKTNLATIKSQIDRIESLLVSIKKRDPEQYQQWFDIVQQLRQDYNDLREMESRVK